MSSFQFRVDNWFIQWLIQWPKYKNQSFDCKYFPQLYNDAMNYTNWWMRPFDYFRNFQEISVFLQCETEAEVSRHFSTSLHWTGRSAGFRGQAADTWRFFRQIDLIWSKVAKRWVYRRYLTLPLFKSITLNLSFNELQFTFARVQVRYRRRNLITFTLRSV